MNSKNIHIGEYLEKIMTLNFFRGKGRSILKNYLYIYENLGKRMCFFPSTQPQSPYYKKNLRSLST